MEFLKYKHIYFLGIGGIGMSALARYFKYYGISVSGFDRTLTDLTLQLSSEGIDVHYDENVDKIPKDVDLVVYTPAIPSGNIEFIELNKKQIPFLKRSQVLGLISQNYFTIAVAGTHGKTTLTSMISHILISSGVEITAFIGGISNNYETNLILSNNSKILVVEADEYDRSFLTLNPNISVITSTDPDHLDIYNDSNAFASTFVEFVKKIKTNGTLIIRNSLIERFTSDINWLEYGIDGNNSIYASSITIDNAHSNFIYSARNASINISMLVPGLHNIENALAAITVAKSLDISNENIQKALLTFKGVKRRFDYRIRRDDLIYIDDYAHHPTEIAATLQAVRSLYPNKKVTVVFQPHLYSRTRNFELEFAKILSKFDTVILLDIYPARELPIDGVSSSNLINLIDNNNKALCLKSKLIDKLKQINPEIIITMGAGDIDQCVSLIERAFT